VKPRNLCPYFQNLISPAPNSARFASTGSMPQQSAAKLVTKDEARDGSILGFSFCGQLTQ
jgi:hypothetical protein